MDVFLLVLCLILAIALIRKTRALGVRAEEDSIRHSVKTVAEQWVSVDMNEETTPPTDLPMSYEEDETQEVDCEAVRQAEDFLMSLADLEDMGE
jgi:diaminopimelate epimerase